MDCRPSRGRPSPRDAYFIDRKRPRGHYSDVPRDVVMNGSYSDYMREYSRQVPPMPMQPFHPPMYPVDNFPPHYPPLPHHHGRMPPPGPMSHPRGSMGDYPTPLMPPSRNSRDRERDRERERERERDREREQMKQRMREREREKERLRERERERGRDRVRGRDHDRLKGRDRRMADMPRSHAAAVDEFIRRTSGSSRPSQSSRSRSGRH